MKNNVKNILNELKDKPKDYSAPNILKGTSSFIITIIFVILKLLNISSVANISWLWIFSPIWISFILAILIFTYLKIKYNIDTSDLTYK